MSLTNGDLRVDYDVQWVEIELPDQLPDVRAELAELYHNIAGCQHDLADEDKIKSWLWMPKFLEWLQERYHPGINYGTAAKVAELVLVTYPELKKKQLTTRTSLPVMGSTPSG